MDKPDEPDKPIDLTNARQRRAAEQACGEKIRSETAPLFHDADDRGWAHLAIDGHWVTLLVDSKEMRHHLQRAHYERTREMFGRGWYYTRKDLNETIEYLQNKALFEGPLREVSLRVAQHDGVLYIDLCDAEWHCVRICGAGWEILESAPSPPVLFRRTQGMLPLPTPERDGSIEDLRSLLNVTDSEFVLIQGFILAALKSGGPYPLAVLCGSPGSAKSTLSRVLRSLIDPNSIPLTPTPHDISDLHVSSMFSHLLVFDNVSKLSQKLSDAYCRISTGGGAVKRQYFTRQEQVRFPSITRPVVCNGVVEFVAAPDLLDRSIVLTMPFIKSNREEAAFWREFEAKQGRIFGALLDRMVIGVKNLPTVTLKKNHRMADFARWCTACDLKKFEDIYTQNRTDATLSLLEGDPLAVAIKAFVEKRRKPWEGTASELSKALKQYGLEEPKNIRSFAVTLKKIVSALRSGLDISVEFLPRRNDTRPIRISKIG